MLPFVVLVHYVVLVCVGIRVSLTVTVTKETNYCLIQFV